RALLMGEEALRRDQVQVILGAGHGDVEQAALFLDLRRRARGEIRRNAAVDRIEEEHSLPLLPFGRMDGREDQIILVDERRTGLVAGRGWRVERELGEEALACG